MRNRTFVFRDEVFHLIAPRQQFELEGVLYQFHWFENLCEKNGSESERRSELASLQGFYTICESLSLLCSEDRLIRPTMSVRLVVVELCAFGAHSRVFLGWGLLDLSAMGGGGSEPPSDT